MSVKSFVCVAVLAVPASAAPVFVPITYSASIGSSPAPGPLSTLVSTSDINTPLSVLSPVFTTVWRDMSIHDTLTIAVSALFIPGSAGRGGSVFLNFSPSSDATLTLGGYHGGNFLSSSNAYLSESGSPVLSHSGGLGFTTTSSVQIYAGHVYSLSLGASVYSTDGATIFAELSDPVPAPAAPALLGLAGLIAARRRR